MPTQETEYFWWWNNERRDPGDSGLAQFLRQFLTVFGVFDQPAERFNLSAQSITLRPVFVCPGGGPFLKKCCDIFWSRLRILLELQHLIDALPPQEECCGLSGYQFVVIDCAVCCANLIEHFGQRRGDIQVVVESVEELVGFCRRELRIRSCVGGNILKA